MSEGKTTTLQIEEERIAWLLCRNNANKNGGVRYLTN
jgi:hypothetical protein